MDFLITPFAWLMQQFMLLFKNYALALLLYALVSKLVSFPLAMKQQKNSLNMVRLRPYQEALSKKYGNNREKYQIELQKLYQREGYNPMGSCGPMLIQLPLIFIIYSIVRHPITYGHYIALSTKETAQKIYDVVAGMTDLPETLSKVVAKIQGGADVTAISDYELQILEVASDKFPIAGSQLFNFIDLSGTPQQEGFLAWTILIPVFVLITSMLQGWISQKLNPMQQDPSAQSTNKMMLYVMPLISTYICYTFNCGLGFYWIIGNILGIAQTFILHKMYDPKKVLAEVEAKIQQEKQQKKDKRSAAAAKKAAALAAGKKKK